MREILFRGKRTVIGDWISGFLVDGTHIGSWLECEPVHPETVGQFTGLTDKNGKKIFEGDIIQHGKRKGTIFYYGNFGMFMISWIPNGGANIFMNVLHTEVEVIGNIHDNPELLEGA